MYLHSDTQATGVEMQPQGLSCPAGETAPEAEADTASSMQSAGKDNRMRQLVLLLFVRALTA